jgi:exopolysaccharide production protein ExoZ
MEKSRYDNLDYLRGLCALSIMIYHYTGWTFGHYGAGNPIGRVGVYGVSLFYVLSGLTMFLVYFNKFNFNVDFFKDFYVKRFFRIFPLMWFVLIASYLVTGTKNTWIQQVIISSGLFSVIDWSASTPLGMWSIGNELSFYLLLPIIFLAFKTNKLFAAIISIIIFSVFVYFAFFMFDPIKENQFEDSNYKNPLNQAGFFLGGILIGYIFKEIKIKPIVINSVFVTSILLFCFYPCHGELRNTYIGVNRLIFTSITFLIAFSFFKINLTKLNGKVKSVLKWFGEISYSLYLMHGLVWSLVLFTGLKIRYILPIAFVSTLVISYFIYKFLETPSRNFGYKSLESAKKRLN